MLKRRPADIQREIKIDAWIFDEADDLGGKLLESRIIADLRPTVLDDFGLAAALRLQVEERQADGWQIVYHETLAGERLPPMVETALFRVAQEALTNVRKHAGTTRVRITLARDAQAVYLTVHDRGAGFAPDAERRGGPPGERVGLAGMRERVALLGGRCQVDSRPGAGTRVVAWVPLAGQGEATDGYRDTPLHQ